MKNFHNYGARPLDATVWRYWRPGASGPDQEPPLTLVLQAIPAGLKSRYDEGAPTDLSAITGELSFTDSYIDDQLSIASDALTIDSSGNAAFGGDISLRPQTASEIRDFSKQQAANIKELLACDYSKEEGNKWGFISAEAMSTL